LEREANGGDGVGIRALPGRIGQGERAEALTSIREAATPA